MCAHVQAVDNDDGSSWYNITNNVFYWAEGLKMDYGGFVFAAAPWDCWPPSVPSALSPFRKCSADIPRTH